jgi:hypothetical protein
VNSLESVLDALAGMGPAALDRFAESIDPAWIEEALSATGTASIRRRKLPANVVVWLVLGMALFRDRSIDQVVDHLGLSLDPTHPPSKSAIPPARERLGPEPMAWLFRRVATAWADTDGAPKFHGLEVFGIDGSHLRVADSDANFAHFGKPGGRGGKSDAGYPQARIAVLLNSDVANGPNRASSRSRVRIPGHFKDFRLSLRGLLLPPRRSARRYPRHVKIKMSNYPRNRGKRP